MPYEDTYRALHSKFAIEYVDILNFISPLAIAMEESIQQYSKSLLVRGMIRIVFNTDKLSITSVLLAPYTRAGSTSVTLLFITLEEDM